MLIGNNGCSVFSVDSLGRNRIGSRVVSSDGGGSDDTVIKNSIRLIKNVKLVFGDEDENNVPREVPYECSVREDYVEDFKTLDAALKKAGFVVLPQGGEDHVGLSDSGLSYTINGTPTNRVRYSNVEGGKCLLAVITDGNAFTLIESNTDFNTPVVVPSYKGSTAVIVFDKDDERYVTINYAIGFSGAEYSLVFVFKKEKGAFRHIDTLCHESFRMSDILPRLFSTDGLFLLGDFVEPTSRLSRRYTLKDSEYHAGSFLKLDGEYYYCYESCYVYGSRSGMSGLLKLS